MRPLRFYTVIFVLLSVQTFAQLQTYKKGLVRFERGEYDLAIKDLLKVTTIAETEKAKLYHTIAESYRLTNRWVDAIPFYEKAFEAKLDNSVAHFHYAFALKAAGKYDLALKELERFIEAKSDVKAFNEKAYREVNTLKIIGSIQEKKQSIEFKNLSQINTKGSEFSPMIRGNELIYTGSLKDKIYSNGLPFVGLYKAKFGNSIAEIGKPEIFSSSLFDSERNEGTPTFSPDGKTVIFARGNTGKRRDLTPDVDLYVSRNVDGVWTEPRYVSASDSASWDGCPAFSRDGKTIYFASNRPGGSGGIDLYRVNMDASGRFGNPANLGKEINTPGDEMFPYVTEDGKLYFASDGHPGLGKLDIFVAIRSGGKITVENMGIPYNSNMDDFGMVVDKNGNIFFSSNRAGGVGDDDIYYYEAPKPDKNADSTTIAQNNPLNPAPPKPTDTQLESQPKIVNYFLAGTITTKNTQGTFVSLDSAKVRILNAENEELITEITTAKNGAFGPIKLQADLDYVILAEKNNYFSKREDFSMTGRVIPPLLLKKPVTDTTFFTTLNLERKFVGVTFVLQNIYYDLDKWDIRPDAALELDKLVQILKDNPDVKIEMGSHTDSRATEKYNNVLSQRRAESAVNYLVSKGIERERLTAKGYGETALIIENAKTEDEHQVNRRTEFKVLEINSKPQNP
ncbi:MAG: OmpA family protein [Spirosomataceae bacterium]